MNLYKYPRTPHLPWSKGMTSDDKVIKSLSAFEGQTVVITEKMDGENTTMYCDHIHARSVDSRHHPSRDWVKNFWNTFRYDIPENMRICGENVYAKHSIAYDNLQSYFYGFSVWEQEKCLSWDDTVEFFQLLGVIPVPVLYRGPYNRILIESMRFNQHFRQRYQQGETEGYVVRVDREFSLDEFESIVAKFVRPNHVQSSEHWMNIEVVANKLIQENRDVIND